MGLEFFDREPYVKDGDDERTTYIYMTQDGIRAKISWLYYRSLFSMVV